MKIRTFIFFLCFLIAASGCNKTTTTEPPPPSGDSLSYTITATGLPPLRSGEFLFIWVKIAPDTGWINIGIPQIHSRNSDGSVVLQGKYFSEQPFDRLKDVLLSLEHTDHPQTIGLRLLRGGALLYDSLRTHATTSLDTKPVLGDYSSLKGSLVFTSPLSDTTAYNHEFYLMNMQGSQQSPSLLSLNQLPSGWKYGLWAVDNNFTPHQVFFYGLFSSSQGHDSDSANDHYPYPGGWKPQAMNIPSGSIIVTLEPEFYGDSLKFKGPSPFILLVFNRIRFIQKDKNFPMTNVTASGLPSGTITFRSN